MSLVTLVRLSRDDGAMLVRELAGNALPSDLVDVIVQRTDGVPFFVEEMTRAIVEGGLNPGTEKISTYPQSSIAVPATFHSSRMSRLDRLTPTAKEVAQIGATIERQFSYDTCQTIASRLSRSSSSRLVGTT